MVKDKKIEEQIKLLKMKAEWNRDGNLEFDRKMNTGVHHEK
mgnify:CR=1 FL=1|tara:strand:- start:4834 stop:4956 length:123 start_codon:yes stop_codon:yes gene_type:complete